MSNRGDIGRYRARARGLLALAVALACPGCILWKGEHHPAVPDHPEAASVSEAPRMRWTIHHANVTEGMSRGQAGVSGAQEHTEIKRALEELQRTMPFLANASASYPDPDYLLQLHSVVEERGIVDRYIFVFTFGVVPWFMRAEIRVNAVLQTPEGETLISHQSEQQIRGISQILLLVALPWTLMQDVEAESFADPLRSAIDAVARDYAHLRATAAAEVQPRE